MENRKFKTVKEYFDEVPPQSRERMVRIREELAKVAPLAEEVISYNMPALNYKGIVVYYAAYEKHIGFYAIPHAHTLFKEELSPYKQGKGSVQFPHDRPLPLDLIKRMTAFRYNEQLGNQNQKME